MKATKKLIIASVSLVAAASLAVGATFAWFSYRSNVELGSVQFGVGSGDENLLVAVAKVGETPAESSFAYTLSEETIKGVINEGSDITYQPLTVRGASGEVGATDAITLEKQGGSNATGSDYAEFDLVFRYTPAAGNSTMPYLILNDGSVITADPADDASYSSSITAWWSAEEEGTYQNKYGPSIATGGTIKARARDAARVAFIYGDSSSKTNKIWAPSEEQAPSVTTSDSPSGYYKNNLASDYAKHLGATLSDVVTPTYASRVYAADNGQSDTINNTIAQFPAISGGKSYSELKITVKVWLEGKDGDCLPSVAGDQFAFLLKFKTGTVS